MGITKKNNRESKKNLILKEGFREKSIPISITAVASISPLGTSSDEAWTNYLKDAHHFTKIKISGHEEWVAALPHAAKTEIEVLKKEDAKYKNLDDSVLYALYASRKAVAEAKWKGKDNFGINMGSSRGATTLFEKFHEEFLKNHRASTLSSPTTTLGNISSWVAHDLQSQGPEISHSITCSTALHAMLNGVAWIKSGMVDKFLVGGSEAPLTPFTIAQMKALKIYAPVKRSQQNAGERLALSANEVSQSHPCQALNLSKNRNTMILGEGASVACLEKGIAKNALAVIEGVGYATEPLRHNTSISTDAECFQRSMRMALKDTDFDEVDVVVMHAPGTVKGDSSEYNAVKKVFCNKIPYLTTNKWKIGHTFGTSGMLSVELALLMLRHRQFVKVPFVEYAELPQRIDKILVNAVGFGGNAVSILLRSVQK